MRTLTLTNVSLVVFRNLRTSLASLHLLFFLRHLMWRWETRFLYL